LLKRFGFIKLALIYGYTVYPGYIFNERKCFYTIEKLKNIGLWLNKYRLGLIIFFSKFGFFPDPNVEIHTVYLFVYIYSNKLTIHYNSSKLNAAKF